jgi:hypothetical protein
MPEIVWRILSPEEGEEGAEADHNKKARGYAVTPFDPDRILAE